MQNKLTELFSNRKKKLLNIYCTAGFPNLHSTTDIILALQQHGADMVEVGIPYSDPVADGPVIQESNSVALKNGITISTLFDQLSAIKDQVSIPVILMGYINPVMQYGIEKFCRDAAAAGVSGVILPDLPPYEFEKYYKESFKKYNLCVCFLISPGSSIERIKKADKLSDGFLYAVSSSATTGTQNNQEDKAKYFRFLASQNLKNKIMIGFGIKDHEGFEDACAHAAGAIIGTAFISHIANETDVNAATGTFIKAIRGI